ncbi:meiosis-specific protein mei4-like [Plakobranchus ocellatus]|uniref:Meiosis-specific protein mei4-like n=1 Tax=Plakobranchus ocellatus TaxID=259542 RepID=A0AAV3ZRW7_9GAST|nr:meiosis-specific protein mei4-like [Plakobranchus ocellatus]
MNANPDEESSPSQYQQGVNVLWMKLAVAVAIICNKPPDITAKKHAENLRAQLFSIQSKHQGRFSITKHSTQPPSVNDGIGDSNVVKACNQQMTPPSSSDVAVSTSQSMETFADQASNILLDHLSWENMRFSRSVIALKNLSLQTSASNHQAVCDAAVSHVQTLHGVLERDLVRISEACLCQAARSLILAMERCPWLQEEASFMQEVCRFVELIVHSLTVQPIDFGQYPAHRQKHSLVSMLLVFLEHAPVPLGLSIVDQLIESLEAFCSSLKQAEASSELMNSELFENSFFTVKCIELTMNLWQRECPAHPALLHEVQRRLNGCLMHITDRYPLVAQAVWRLISLVEAILQNR